jgi:hypothetical protein
MNEDDRRRLLLIWGDAVEAAEGMKSGGVVNVTIRIDKAGHVCRRRSTVEVRTFPLDGTARPPRS